MKRCVEYFACAAVVSFFLARGVCAQTPPASSGSHDYGNDIPVAVGQMADGIRFPYWENGRLKKMFFNVGTLEHKDIEHILMKNAKIITYDENEKTDLILLLPVSMFNLKTRLLTTDQQFMLKRADFEMTGQALQLDTATRQATIIGNIKMIIYNFNAPAKKATPHE